MTDKRLFFALAPLALLAACGEEPADDGRAASGEVLEGTISDAMLPLDSVQSEPPLENPEAFAEAQEEAAAEAPEGGEGEGGAEAEPADTEGGDADESIVVPSLEPAQ
jgi:hypothetical protein